MIDNYNEFEAGRTENSARSFLRPFEPGALRGDQRIKEVYSISVSLCVEAYLVGGAIRNIALGRGVTPDFDFILSGDVAGFAEAVALKFGGTAFILDKETSSYRVALNEGASATFDFSPVKKDIITDLKSRDFTVNAMAVSLESLFSDRPFVIDPADGLGDAKRGVLKMVSGSVFDDDPLRCLRAIRISQQYGLEITDDTMSLIVSKAPLLERTSAERVREELIALFLSDGTSKSIRKLYSLGIMRTILPGLECWADVDGYDLLTHSLKTLDEAERIVKTISEETFPGLFGRLEEHFKNPIGPVRREAFFKMAAFLHDTGKPYTIKREDGRLRFIGHDFEGSHMVKEMLLGLRFSRRFSGEVSNLVRNHHRVFMLAALKERSFRAKGHFFRAAGDGAGIDLLLLSLADARATRGGEDYELYKIVIEMLFFYFDTFTKKRPKPLLNGSEVMEIFGIPEGKLVGEILGKVSEGIEKGEVRSRKDAVKYAREWLKERG